MILTGNEIKKQVGLGNIYIYPFNADQLNPNSYNYRLGEIIKEYIGFDGVKNNFREIVIPQTGFMLKSGQMYLGHTEEIIGSNKYMSSLIGRSSVGRLGLFLQLSANVLHTGTCHKITLEIYATKNIIIYPSMIIGQVSFRENMGDIDPYNGHYKGFNTPQESYLATSDR